MRVSGGAASQYICFVADWHQEIEEKQKCKIPCTKNSGCLNINATHYQTDPRSKNKFPVQTGLLSLAEEIWKTLGIPVIMNTEALINNGERYAGNYTTVSKGLNSAMGRAITISRNCIAKPAFEEAIQQGRHHSATTCLNSNIHRAISKRKLIAGKISSRL
jgi:2,4-dienoyl-CoA reductase-like NADH-dependent reductase (Old Yellow Enzyme family)